MKLIKKIIVVLTVSLVLVACNNAEAKRDNVLSIGVIQYASHPALDATYEGFIEGLNSLGLKENEDYVIDFQNAHGDISTAETIATKFVADDHDLIYAIATPAAQTIANKTSDIPIIVNAVTDPKTAGLVESNELPNTNVSGVSDLTPVKRQIELLHDIDPAAKTIAIIYANSEDNSRFQADLAKTEIESLRLEWKDASVSESNQLQQMTESLIGKVDAIYVPTDNMAAENYSIITSIAYEHKITTVSGEPGMVEAGGLITDGISYLNLGKKAGQMAYQVLVENVNIKTLPISYLSDEDLELYINTTTQEQLGLDISDDLLNKAIIIK